MNSAETPESASSGESSAEHPQLVNRRRWLALCAGTSTVGLAGCLDALGGDDVADADANDDGESTDDEDDADGDDDEQREADAASEQYDDAITELVESAETLAHLADESTDATQSDIDQLERGLERANSALDDAEADAPDQLQTKIDAARDVVAFQRELAEYHEVGIEFDNAWEAAFAYWETLDLDRAYEEFGRTSTVIEDTLDQVETARATHGEMAHGVIETTELDYSGEFWEYIDPDSLAEIEMRGEFVVGLQQFTVTLDLMVAGEEAFEAGEFTEAREHFESAVAEAETTIQTFREIEEGENTPDEFRLDVIEFRGQIEAWREPIESFEAAAQAGENGDIEDAEQLYQEGLEALPE